MSDFIEREAAIKLFNFAVLDCLGMEPTIRAGDIVKALESIPAADVRPVVWGKWIWKKSGEVVCSKCNDLMAIVGNTEDLITVKSSHSFCSNCGADMREES